MQHLISIRTESRFKLEQASQGRKPIEASNARNDCAAGSAPSAASAESTVVLTRGPTTRNSVETRKLQSNVASSPNTRPRALLQHIFVLSCNLLCLLSREVLNHIGYSLDSSCQVRKRYGELRSLLVDPASKLGDGRCRCSGSSGTNSPVFLNPIRQAYLIAEPRPRERWITFSIIMFDCTFLSRSKRLETIVDSFGSGDEAIRGRLVVV